MSGYTYSAAHRDGLARQLQPLIVGQTDIAFRAAVAMLEQIQPSLAPLEGKVASTILRRLGFNRVYGELAADRGILYRRSAERAAS